MLNDLFQYIEDEKLFISDEKLLLTVSGGLDSMVMTELFRLAGYNFAVAHCNFNLRGNESDGDEEFVNDYCNKHKIQYFVKHFDTKKIASEKGISIQMAARELRYEWFDYLCDTEGFNYYATAHHKDDQIETFFINLLRGTGIAGLHGILSRQGRVIRPLLFTGRDDIEEYAQKNNLSFREDSSNNEVKYLRNSIRHRLLPVLKEINPGYQDMLTGNIERFRETEKVYRREIDRMKGELVISENDLIRISIPKLLKTENQKIFLFEILSEYSFNFSQVEDVINSIDAISGKTFFSKTHTLIKDRNEFIIAKLESENEENVKIYSDTSYLINPKNITIKTIEKTANFKIIPDPAFASFDKNELKFPLEIRKWEKGDFFYPLGMKNRKKLSDFLIDEKISIIEKQKIYVLTSGDDIAWVIGYRIDDRYKITGRTKSVLLLEVVN